MRTKKFIITVVVAFGLCAFSTCSRKATLVQPKSEMASESEAWERIHAWLGEHAGKILASLNPAASQDDIDAAEMAIGIRMPAEWQALYRTHNGMNAENNLGSLFFGMTFDPLDEVIRECSGNAAVVENLGREYEPVVVRAADPGIRKHDIHNPKWIRFANASGDTLLSVDMDPAEGGQIGQVIFIDYADDTVIMVAPSLSEFLRGFVDDLESGRYFLDKQALSEGNQFLDCQKEIDIVNWALSPRWKHLLREH